MRGTFYDGYDSQAHSVEVRIQDNTLLLESDQFKRCYPVPKIRTLENVPGTPLKLMLDDTASLEIEISQANDLPLQLRTHEGLYARLLKSPGLVIAIAMACLLVAWLSYTVILPLGASVIAKQLPTTTLNQMGEHALRLMDEQVFSKSTLSSKQRAKILALFAALKDPATDKIPMRLRFRSSKLGPNAFALPNGTIVVTDELVRLVNNDNAVMGAIAHEIGHVQHRHLLRQLIQSGLVGGVMLTVFGDSSSMLTALSTASLSTQYSREFETEADQFAIDRFKKKRLPLADLLVLQEKLATLDLKNAAGNLLSTHPGSAARLSMIRKAMQNPP